MPLNIPDEYVSFLNHTVTSGAFSCTQDAMRHALELLAAEQAQRHDSPVQTSRQHSDRMTEIRVWSQSHPPVSHLVDDSRESIYEGRGQW